jgi:hypothetical protein
MSVFSTIPADIRRSACAFHEAGHIVVGWQNRRYISHAWLRPPHGFSGEVCFEPYLRGFHADSPADLRRAEIEITILSAGHCGEMIYWNEGEGLRWYPGAISSHEDDLQQMTPYIALLRPPDEAALQARCAAAAAAILYRPSLRAAHAAIARRLRDGRRIDRDEVEEIMARETTG